MTAFLPGYFICSANLRFDDPDYRETLNCCREVPFAMREVAVVSTQPNATWRQTSFEIVVQDRAGAALCDWCARWSLAAVGGVDADPIVTDLLVVNAGVIGLGRQMQHLRRQPPDRVQ